MAFYQQAIDAMAPRMDGVSPDYLRRLWIAINHAATPNHTVVARTFSDPVPNTVANWAPLDRWSLWGAVEVSRTTEICAGGEPCFTC